MSDYDPNYEELKSALPDDEGWRQVEENLVEFGDPAPKSQYGLPERCPEDQHEWASIIVCRVCLEQPSG